MKKKTLIRELIYKLNSYLKKISSELKQSVNACSEFGFRRRKPQPRKQRHGRMCRPASIEAAFRGGAKSRNQKRSGVRGSGDGPGGVAMAKAEMAAKDGGPLPTRRNPPK